jgi:acyl carrier protein
MQPDRLSRLTEVFRRVFHQPSLALHDALTARDVPGWDSLNHVTLMIEVEREFGLRFSSAEIEALRRVGDLVALVDRKSGA